MDNLDSRIKGAKEMLSRDQMKMIVGGEDLAPISDIGSGNYKCCNYDWWVYGQCSHGDLGEPCNNPPCGYGVKVFC